MSYSLQARSMRVIAAVYGVARTPTYGPSETGEVAAGQSYGEVVPHVANLRRLRQSRVETRKNEEPAMSKAEGETVRWHTLRAMVAAARIGGSVAVLAGEQAVDVFGQENVAEEPRPSKRARLET